MSFFDIVLGNGLIGLLIWSAIIALGFAGFVLGIISVLESCHKEKDQIPLSFKLLLIGLGIYLFIGALGVISGVISACEGLEISSGATKAQTLALGISNTFYTASATLLGAITYVCAIVASIVALHINQAKSTPVKQMDEEEEL